MHYIIQRASAQCYIGHTDFKKNPFFSKIHARVDMGWDPTMQVVPWVGCQSKMKSPNFEITVLNREKKGKKTKK